jgi:hypothetical protein
VPPTVPAQHPTVSVDVPQCRRKIRTAASLALVAVLVALIAFGCRIAALVVELLPAAHGSP